MTSPTARTLAECRTRGWLAQVVERWNPYARVRVDLFGFIDLLACVEGRLLGIQATTNANAASRLTKILEHPNAGAWLRTGCELYVWSWGQYKWRLRSGAWSRARRWRLTERRVTLTELRDATP